MSGPRCVSCCLADIRLDVRYHTTVDGIYRAAQYYKTVGLCSAVAFGAMLLLDWYIPAAVLGAASVGCGVVRVLLAGWFGGHKDRGEAREWEAARCRRAHSDVQKINAGPTGWLNMARALVGAPTGRGYLYVILFSTGVVKVGQTRDPQRRFAEHRRQAEVFDVSIHDVWLSGEHDDYMTNETLLKAHCSRIATPIKPEYFRDVDFGTVVAFARSIQFAGVRSGTGIEPHFINLAREREP